LFSTADLVFMLKGIISLRSFWIFISSLLIYLLLSSLIDFRLGKSLYHYFIQRDFTQTEKSIQNFFTQSKLQEADLDFLKYHEDSLIEWSTHLYPAFAPSDIKSDSISIVYNSNGVFLLAKKEVGSFSFVIFKNYYERYPYENEYLKNGFTWNSDWFQGIELVSEPTEHPIKTIDGAPIAFLNFQNKLPGFPQTLLLLILAFIIFTSALALTFRLVTKTFINKIIQRIAFYIVLLFLFLLSTFLPGFELLKNTEIYSPSSFAYTSFFPSVMHLFFFLFSLLVLLIFEIRMKKKEIGSTGNMLRWLQWLLISLVYLAFVKTLPFIVQNTAANLEFSALTQINLVSILIFISIALLILNVIALIHLITFPIREWKRIDIIPISIILVLSYFALHVSLVVCSILLVLFFLVLFKSGAFFKSQLTFSLILILLLSITANLIINEENQQKELDRRKILIQTLALNQDPEVEFLFGELEKDAYQDVEFKEMVQSAWYDGQRITNYLQSNFFIKHKHWERYDFQITSCDELTNLILKPSNVEISCANYFYNNLISKGYISSNNNLYRMEYGSGQINYLGILRFFTQDSIQRKITIYIEINSKIKRKGFTKLLSSPGMDPFEKIRDYSLARYSQGFLTETYGDYAYTAEFADSLKTGQTLVFDRYDYNHLLYQPSDKQVYILSKPKKESIQKAAPFANLIVLTLLFAILFFVLINPDFRIWVIPQTFSFRLQGYIIVLLTVSMLFVALVSGQFLRHSNEVKDLDSQNWTAISLQKEFEQKLSKTVEEGQDMRDYLYELSIKFSKVFNTNINLYDLDGKLISATIPQLFDDGLLSTRMNPQAYRLLKQDKNTYINLKEKIGELEYYSAYMPFHDRDGHVVAYLNLPRITLQDKLSKEVSNFIMTMMNMFMLILVLSMLLVLVLSNYILRPLRLIRDRMQQIKFGQKNEHIHWQKNDELGELVDEYNRMVDQIARSAEILARAERESAWQDMARQVAHEIKNPLTPMKLSVQYLIKSIEEEQEGYEDKVVNLSQTLIDQIDTLSNIATAFSDFAKMPQGKMEPINLKELLESSLNLFRERENLTLEVSYETENAMILGDRQNLLRVMNNLLKNATQSIDYQEAGRIKVSLQQDDDQWKVSVEDNGCGIKEEEKGRIFQPNFTTKSSGMGLGLVMVRNILLQHGGSIDFESELNKGSTFNFWLKIYE
jgi:two-component system nitrogen regulation sensor histidine kinase NtrY